MSFKPIDGGVASAAPYIPGSTLPDASGQGSTPASRAGEASAPPALADLAAARMQAVTGLMNEVGRMAGQGADQAPASTAPLIIAEHPLAGQAVNDFTSPTPSFVPAALDPQPEASREGGGSGAPSFGEGTRLLRFYSPLPADKTLLIDSMTGSAALSEQYVFHLNLLSTDASIDLQDVIAKSVSVGVQLADGSEHFINGYVRTFGFTHADGGFAFYHAEIVPWLSYLKLRINSR
ncbi:contractile injection system protein, VgrG/Pvc8 family, partial [Massilia sp. MS-15]|uniref:contractile injection system protein, VgrG/Pvc8 family n=1 Tax=Massilia sp. MS-15 TaxID=2878200 RepID=UPI001CD5A512